MRDRWFIHILLLYTPNPAHFVDTALNKDTNNLLVSKSIEHISFFVRVESFAAADIIPHLLEELSWAGDISGHVFLVSSGVFSWSIRSLYSGVVEPERPGSLTLFSSSLTCFPSHIPCTPTPALLPTSSGSKISVSCWAITPKLQTCVTNSLKTHVLRCVLDFSTSVCSKLISPSLLPLYHAPSPDLSFLSIPHLRKWHHTLIQSCPSQTGIISLPHSPHLLYCKVQSTLVRSVPLASCPLPISYTRLQSGLRILRSALSTHPPPSHCSLYELSKL